MIHKTYRIEKHPDFTTYYIRVLNKGRVSDELNGSYTNVLEAQKAIDAQDNIRQVKEANKRPALKRKKVVKNGKAVCVD